MLLIDRVFLKALNHDLCWQHKLWETNASRLQSELMNQHLTGVFDDHLPHLLRVDSVKAPRQTFGFLRLQILLAEVVVVDLVEGVHDILSTRLVSILSLKF